ncbi:MAG: hypothetical protein A3G23_09455 [Bacteroidetes bacterium RIFCSPLOWO2_12_FULL_37_12]|nr:MAG: hypothetical protein A3G23_09455 [Bacteroidetes bacterium RIFCSPLOWO2_12_FULL_37_12]
MFGIKEKTFAQLRDGTGCGKAVIIPLPAQTCNNREFEIKEKEMWFEFQGSGTEVSLKLSPGAQNPVNELTEVVLFKERGGCPDLEEIKKEHIGRLENEKHIVLARVEHGVNYKLKLVREVRTPEKFVMCLRRDVTAPCEGIWIKNSSTGNSFSGKIKTNESNSSVPSCSETNNPNSTQCSNTSCTIGEVCVGVVNSFEVTMDDKNLAEYIGLNYKVSWYINDNLIYGPTPLSTSRRSYFFSSLVSGVYAIEVQISSSTGTFIRTSGKLNIIVFPLPVITLTTTPSSATICQGSSAKIITSGATPQYYSWSTGEIYSAITVFPTNSSDYSVTATDLAGCKNTASATITVNSKPTITLTATPSATICQESYATITASGTATQYSWSTGEINTAITVFPTSSSSYSVTATDTEGCTNTSSVTVTVIPKPTVSFTTTPSSTICQGSSATITASIVAPKYYLWSTGATTSAITVSPNVNPSSYSVTVTNTSGCTNTASTSITVNSKPTISFTTSTGTTICQGSSATITASIVAPKYYVWSTGATTSAITVTPANSTSYSVTATNTSGCTNTSSVGIIVNSIPATPVIDGSDNTCGGLNATYSINNPQAGVSYQWLVYGGTFSFLPGTFTSISVSWNSLSGGSINVTATKSGCSSVPVFKVVAPCPCDNNVINYSTSIQGTNADADGNITIYSNTTWTGNTSVNFEGNIIINHGASLTINGLQLYFSPNSSVIVKGATEKQNGGTLNLNGPLLSAVGTCMWQGIQVNGYEKREGTNQEPPNKKRGAINLKNNTIIEHAHTGVTTSGVIKANSGTMFRNNNKAVVINNLNMNHVNLSLLPLITKCFFYCDAPLRDVTRYGNNARSSVFIELLFSYLPADSNPNLGFILDNDFYNSPENNSNTTTAIRSTNSTYDVVNNRFDNVHRGISVENTLMYPGSIENGFDQNTFTRIMETAVFIKNCIGSVVTHNFIHDTQTSETVGILLENCTGSHVLYNNIDSYKSGIVVLNTNSTFTGWVHKNNISSSRQAINMGGNNSGILVHCNTLSDYKFYGFNIYKYPTNDATAVGILQPQGICENLESDFPAGNHFNVTSSDVFDIFNDYPSQTVFYVYDNETFNNGDNSVNPDVFSSGVTVTGCPTGSTSDNYCADLLLQPPHNEQTLRNLIPNTKDAIERAKLLSELLSLLMPQQKENEIIPFLQAINTLESKKILIPALINNNKFLEARLEMSSIPVDNFENTCFVQFHSLVCDLAEQGKTFQDLDTNQLQFIRTLAYDNTTTLNTNAQAVLSFLTGEHFPVTCEMVNDCETALRKSGNKANESLENDKNLIHYEIIPNPLNHTAKIQYSANEYNISLEVRFFDLLGKKLKSFPLNPNQHELYINFSDLKNGTYLCSFLADGKPISFQKIIVVK